MDYTVTESLSERVPNGSKAGMRRAYAQQKLFVILQFGDRLLPDALRLLTFSSFYYSYFFLFIIFISLIAEVRPVREKVYKLQIIFGGVSRLIGYNYSRW